MSKGTRLAKRASTVVVLVGLLGACSGSGSSTTTYPWTATPEQSGAVGAAREMDALLAKFWVAYSDGLLLHHMYAFCEDLYAASDVEAFLDERAETQGEVVLLPLVVGSPYLCAERSAAVGDWIARHAASE
jgi:hypothetical protein